MERELIVGGIGGQGVQVATRALARAAEAQGLHVMLFGMFGGSVRGGRSETTLVVSEEPIEAPPIVPETWSALGLHPKYFDAVAARVRPDGVRVLNSSLFGDVSGALGVPMTAMAEEMGNAGLVGMIGLGAYIGATRIVSLEAAIEGMRAEIPTYRAARIPQNEDAIARGASAAGVRA